METELIADSINEPINTEVQNTSVILKSKTDSIEIDQQTTKIKTVKTQKEYSLGAIKIKLIQYKSDGSDFFCKSEIIITKKKRGGN